MLEGWLYLARPALACTVLLFAFVVWSTDRAQSRRARQQAERGPLRPGWWLEVLHPGVAHSVSVGTLVPVEGAVTLGRSPDCVLVLEDPAVSAVHAVVTADAAGCRVQDLGSRNGTLVDRARVEGTRELAAGSEVRLGDVILGVRNVAAKP